MKNKKEENYLDELLNMSVEELEKKDQDNFEQCIKKLQRHGFNLKIYKFLCILSLLSLAPIFLTYGINLIMILPFSLSLLFLRLINIERKNINLMIAFIEHVYISSYK